MKITVKKELLVERERTVTIKLGGASRERFCNVCRQRTLFITVDEAALLRQTTARHIFQMVEADLIHYDETDNGFLLICFQSLSNITSEKSLPIEKSGIKQTKFREKK